MDSEKLYNHFFSDKSITDTLKDIMDNDKNFKSIEKSSFAMIRNSIEKEEYKFSAYRLKRVLKNNNKIKGETRDLFIAQSQDFLVLTLVNKYLCNFYKNRYNLNIPNVSAKVDEIVERLENNKTKNLCILKLDIKDFYPTVKNSRLLKILLNDGVDRRVVKLIEFAIFNRRKNFKNVSNRKIKGIPQGIPISNILSEIYLRDFKNKRVVRYVDDILVFCNYNYRHLHKFFVWLFLKSIGLRLNKDKSKHILQLNNKNFCLIFLGYSFKFCKSNLIIGISKDGLTRRIRRISEIYKKYDERLRNISKESNQIKRYNGNVENFKDDLTKKTRIEFLNEINIFITGYINPFGEKRGWFAYYNKINNIEQLSIMDYIFRYKLIKKFQYLKNLDNMQKEINSHVRSYFEHKKTNSKYIYNYELILSSRDNMEEFLISKCHIDKKAVLELSEEEMKRIIFQTMLNNTSFIDNIDPDYINSSGIDLAEGSGQN